MRSEAPESSTLVLEEQAAHLLRRAHQRASAIFVSLIGERQLTPAQYFAMVRLAEMGELSQNRLGRLAAMDPATVQGVTRRLVERGMIERKPDKTDRRRMLLRLTELGHQVIDELSEIAEKTNKGVLAPLSPGEQEMFVSLLRRLT
ncbi:MAG: MarR family transcriptional regulator [Kiloniellales bacterium]|nr:MarR family transcriptional regulator [Kiloniellales bacterium]